MNITEARKETVRIFAQRGSFHPSHTDVRCMMNDLVDYGKSYCQDAAFKWVRGRLRVIEEILSEFGGVER